MFTPFTYRTVTQADLPAMYDIFAQEQREIHGSFAMSQDDFEKDWLLFNFTPQTDGYAAFVDDKIAGYVEVRVFRSIPVRPNMYGYVRPEYRGQGIGSCLLEWAKERAQGYIPLCPPEARITLNGYTPFDDGQRLMLESGFVQTRQSYVMGKKFEGEQPAPLLPEGFRFQSMAEGATQRDIVYLYKETFRDHRGSIDEPMEAVMKRWQDIIDTHTDFDPALVVRVLHGDTPAGVIITMPSDDGDEETGFVETLGVMPAYRKQGLGMALLQLTFHQLQARGRTGVVLSVDASSLTGAVRLYERAGMHIRSVFHVLEQEIRPGVELTNQG